MMRSILALNRLLESGQGRSEIDSSVCEVFDLAPH